MRENKTYNIFGHEFDKTDINNIIFFALIVAIMMLAYNIGHYDSLQYQKMYSHCNEPDININISTPTIDYEEPVQAKETDRNAPNV
jgi:hypothetical protein